MEVPFADSYPRIIAGPHRHSLFRTQSCTVGITLTGPDAAISFGVRMQPFFFRINNGQYSEMSEQGSEYLDHRAAWKEMTKVCGDIVGGISRNLKENSEWKMELLDKSRKPVFCIRLVAETLD
jgi:hypothetical protein